MHLFHRMTVGCDIALPYGSFRRDAVCAASQCCRCDSLGVIRSQHGGTVMCICLCHFQLCLSNTHRPLETAEIGEEKNEDELDDARCWRNNIKRLLLSFRIE